MPGAHDDDATLPGSRQPAPAGSPAPSSASSVAITAAERYDLGPLLGRGGMGEVRLARDTRIDREVAVKLMRSELRDSPNVARFFREARVQGALEHPSVVPVHDLGIDAAGNPFFVMKRLAGRTLAEVIRAPGEAWPRNTVLSRFTDICLAMEFAHRRGVVHRDLKPANIMVGEFGEAYVLDWGLARVGDDQQIRDVVPLSGDGLASGDTAAGDLLGTPGYMAPEQIQGEVVSAAADVFSLGCVLYEILAGEPALPGGMQAIALTLAADDHRPSTCATTADIPPELDDLCAEATATDPQARPTARELAERIRAYLDGDRDLAQRRELATHHARRALAAFEVAMGRALGPNVSDMTATTRRAPMSIHEATSLVDARTRADAADAAGAFPESAPNAQHLVEARALATREAGRALVLDPSNEDAQHVMSRLLLEPPRELPPEVIATIEAERARALQRVMRASVLPYSMLVVGFLLVFLFPVHHAWPVLIGCGLSAANTALLYAMSRRTLPTTSPLYRGFLVLNLAILGVGAVILGPFLLVPVFTIGSLTATLAQPVKLHRAVLVVTHMLPLAIETALELTGVLPHTFAFVDGGLKITPWVFDFTPTATVVIFLVGMVVQFATSTAVITIQRYAQMSAQSRVHAQAWQLRQLDPRVQQAAASGPASAA